MKMLDSLRALYDYIIIDAPPLGLAVDGAIIAKNSDGAVIVLNLEGLGTVWRRM